MARLAVHRAVRRLCLLRRTTRRLDRHEETRMDDIEAEHRKAYRHAVEIILG